MSKFKSLLPLFLTVFLTACTFSPAITDSELITVEFPQWPPYEDLSYPELSRWKVSVCQANYNYSFYTRDNQTALFIKKNRPLSLLVQPVTLMTDKKENIFFKPAGFLYPCDEEAYSAEWEKGFLADIMAKFFKDCQESCTAPSEAQYLVERFNWKKAQQVIEDKTNNSSSSLFYNPWLINYNALLQNLSVSQFKQSLLNQTGTVALPLYLIQNKYNNPDIHPLSSYIPENTCLSEKNQFSIKKNSPELFLIDKDHAIYSIYKSEKNISLELVYLPILKDKI